MTISFFSSGSSTVTHLPLSQVPFLMQSLQSSPSISSPSLTSLRASNFRGRTSGPAFLPANSNPCRQTKVKADANEPIIFANSNTSYAAPLQTNSGSSFMIRPLAEILRDLNKRVPDQVLREGPGNRKYIPWYQANRMLSFYAPGWCGEVRDITYSSDGKFVTVIYRLTIRGSDGEMPQLPFGRSFTSGELMKVMEPVLELGRIMAFREASGTVCTAEAMPDPTQEAEATAFVRACARFGLGLYLHHGDPQ